jgi:VWFA-related protein
MLSGDTMLRSSKCFLGSAFTAFIFAAIGSAQIPQPSQPPAQQPSSQSNITTLHSTTQLVVVDVVVTDKHQNPVRDLKASDFTLLEKGTPQQIKTFEEHTAPPAADKLPPMPTMPPGVFTNFSFVPGQGAINVLLLDMLNTPVSDQVYAREQIKNYINGASPNSRIAIFGLTGSRLVILQGFTSDPALLKAAINQKGTRPSPLLADNVGGGTQAKTASQTFADGPGLDGPGGAALLANLKQFDATQQAFDQQLQVKYTLDALNLLARSLAGIPGRKNLLWFSDAFPLRIMTDLDAAIGSPVLKDPYAVLAGSEDEFRETTGLLARAQVAVYPIDVRGVVASPVNNSTIGNHAYAGMDSAHNAVHDENQFEDQTIGEHSTMMQLADGTGGRAFINTNDLTQAVAKSIEAGSNYYTLTYSPLDAKWDSKFRNIQVKLQEKGLTLAFRRGYYADNPDAPARKDDTPAVTAAKAVHPLDPMHSAMLRGGPQPTQIIFKVRVLPATPGPEELLAAHNVVNPDLNIQGPYRRYIIDYAASPRQLLFTRSPEGNYQGDVQFQAYVYDQDGKLFNTVEDKSHANLMPADYAILMRGGIPWHQEISVPIKGEFYLRIGVHDLIGNRVGAVEIPVASVKNLAPIAPSSIPEKPPPPAATTK